MHVKTYFSFMIVFAALFVGGMLVHGSGDSSRNPASSLENGTSMDVPFHGAAKLRDF